MKTLLTFLMLVFACLGTTLFSQITTKSDPPSFAISTDKSKIPVVTTPKFDLKAVQAEDDMDAQDNLLPRFGYPHDVNYTFDNSGQWETLPNGDRLWRLVIESADALAISLLYRDFQLPKHAQFFVYNEDQTDVVGAVTHLNNKPNGVFATRLIKGDKVTLEYYLPAEVTEKGSFTISRIVHAYRMVNGPDKDFGDSGPCNVNINCAAGANWQDEKKGIALITVNGGVRWCTGSLIHNTNQNCEPYFLTANHCLSGWAIPTPLDAITNPDASAWMFYWNYESPACSPNTDGNFTYSSSGATVIANAPNSDFALLELDENPVGVYDVYFNGWNRANTAATTATGIHHPSGDVKKICVENNTLTSTNYLGTSTNSAFPTWRAADWDVGVTEGGSSGSPLFDQNSRIVGQLWGGFAACNGSNDNGQSDWYGKIWYSWNYENTNENRRKLSPWLDPSNTGAMTVDGSYPSCLPNDLCANAITLSCGETVSVSTIGATNTGAPNCSNQFQGVWYKFNGNGGNLQASTCGLTGEDTVLEAFEGSCGSLTCVAYNDDFCSLQSQITFLAEINKTYYIYARGVNGAPMSFDMYFECLPPPNDECANATPISCGNTYANQSNITATANGVGPTCTNVFGTPVGIWYTYAGDGKTVTLSTCNDANFDTAIEIYEGSCGSLTCVAGNDDKSGCSGNTSEVQFYAQSGTTYSIYVRGYTTNSKGIFDLTVSCCGPSVAPGVGEVVWTGCTDTNWDNGLNWNSGMKPQAGEAVIIATTSTGNYPVLSTVSNTALSVFVNASTSLGIPMGGNLSIDGSPAHGLNNEGNLTIFSGGSVTVQNTGSDGFRNYDATVLNQGTIIISNAAFKSLNNAFGAFTNDGGSITTNGSGIGVTNQDGTFFNINGGTITTNNSGIGIRNWSVSGSPTFTNEALLVLNNTSDHSIFNENAISATFTNAQCGAIYAARDINNEDVFNNMGYIDYLSANFTNIGTFDNTGGYIHDPNNVMDCPSLGGSCVSAISYADFTGDLDGDMVSFCEGDYDDLCDGSMVVTSSADDGPGSLRYVIYCAPSGSTITFDAATNGSPIYLSSGEILLGKDLVIEGNGTASTIIDGSMDGNSRLFKVNNNSNVEFSYMKLQYGGGPGFSSPNGGIHIGGQSTVKMKSCRMIGNETAYVGGAVGLGASDTFVAVNCIFHENKAAEGGVVWNEGTVQLIQCLFYENVVTIVDAVMANVATGDAMLLDCTIGSNDAIGTRTISNNGVNLSLYNNIFYGNNGAAVLHFSGAIMGYNNLIDNYAGSTLTSGVNGNITGDPLFANPAAGDFRLLAGSPCINEGDQSLLPVDAWDIDNDSDVAELIDIDQFGLDRVFGNELDMGAFEAIDYDCRNGQTLRCGDSISGNTAFNLGGMNSDCLSSGTNAAFSDVVWFTLVGNGQTLHISTCDNPSASQNEELHVYTGDCPSLVCVATNSSCPNGFPEMNLATTAGVVYHVMYARYNSTPVAKDYKIDVTCICGNDNLGFTSPIDDFTAGDNYLFETDGTVQADNVLYNGASIHYNGGGSVSLENNFEAQLGAVLTVTADGCPPPVGPNGGEKNAGRDKRQSEAFLPRTKALGKD